MATIAALAGAAAGCSQPGVTEHGQAPPTCCPVLQLLDCTSTVFTVPFDGPAAQQRLPSGYEAATVKGGAVAAGRVTLDACSQAVLDNQTIARDVRMLVVEVRLRPPEDSLAQVDMYVYEVLTDAAPVGDRLADEGFPSVPATFERAACTGCVRETVSFANGSYAVTWQPPAGQEVLAAGGLQLGRHHHGATDGRALVTLQADKAMDGQAGTLAARSGALTGLLLPGGVGSVQATVGTVHYAFQE